MNRNSSVGFAWPRRRPQSVDGVGPFYKFVESLGVEVGSLSHRVIDKRATPGSRIACVVFKDGESMLEFVRRFQRAMPTRRDLHHLAAIVGSGYATVVGECYLVCWPMLGGPPLH